MTTWPMMTGWGATLIVAAQQCLHSSEQNGALKRLAKEIIGPDFESFDFV